LFELILLTILWWANDLIIWCSYSGNLCLGPNACAPSPAPVPTTGPSHKNKSNVPAIIGATIGGLIVVTAITLVLVRHCKRVDPHNKFSDTHSYPFIPTPGMCFLCFELKSNNMFLQTIPHHRISTTWLKKLYRLIAQWLHFTNVLQCWDGFFFFFQVIWSW
jgi:hypothetical protein